MYVLVLLLLLTAGCTARQYTVCRGEEYCTSASSHEEAIRASEIKKPGRMQTVCSAYEKLGSQMMSPLAETFYWKADLWTGSSMALYEMRRSL